MHAQHDKWGSLRNVMKLKKSPFSEHCSHFFQNIWGAYCPPPTYNCSHKRQEYFVEWLYSRTAHLNFEIKLAANQSNKHQMTFPFGPKLLRYGPSKVLFRGKKLDLYFFRKLRKTGFLQQTSSPSGQNSAKYVRWGRMSAGGIPFFSIYGKTIDSIS